MIRETFLCKYGEIILKGANRTTFEALLTREVKRRLYPFGPFSVKRAQSTVFVEPKEDFCDMEGAYETLKHIFGFVGVTRAAVAEKTMESILSIAREYLPSRMAGARTFRVDAKRSDKSFPLGSPEIAAQVGGVLLSAVRGIKVDLHHPDAAAGVQHHL